MRNILIGLLIGLFTGGIVVGLWLDGNYSKKEGKLTHQLKKTRMAAENAHKSLEIAETRIVEEQELKGRIGADLARHIEAEKVRMKALELRIKARDFQISKLKKQLEEKSKSDVDTLPDDKEN